MSVTLFLSPNADHLWTAGALGSLCRSLSLRCRHSCSFQYKCPAKPAYCMSEETFNMHGREVPPADTSETKHDMTGADVPKDLQPVPDLPAPVSTLGNAIVKRKKRFSRLAFDIKELLGRDSSEAAGSMSEKLPERTWVPPPPPAPRARALFNAAALAYIGDSIYELYARRHFLHPPQAIDKYNKRVTAVVCCEAQDWLLRRLMATDVLTANERDVVRWGKGGVASGARKAKGRAGRSVYSSATALETLVGYLYMTDSQRLDHVMTKLGFGCDSSVEVLPGGQGDDEVTPPQPVSQSDKSPAGSFDSPSVILHETGERRERKGGSRGFGSS
eukprot:TRINITY_DN3729_c0_g1_i1.p1 TRINITY_DN3729_c0_g1~~TRINITY_DN3729_c0_g1_i1.p1  ORF type:complete len:331 (+),score=48.59 TRINITY_DN3729_c0_g1_i1:381-1373(+)